MAFGSLVFVFALTTDHNILNISNWTQLPFEYLFIIKSRIIFSRIIFSYRNLFMILFPQ